MNILATEASGFFELIDRFGVSVSMLALFMLGAAYVLRRLFSPKDGIFTRYVKSTEQQQERLAETAERQAETAQSVARVLEGVEKRLKVVECILDRMEELHYDPESHISTLPLHRCFRYGCDVLEAVADKLDIADRTGPLLDLMRRELDRHPGLHIPPGGGHVQPHPPGHQKGPPAKAP